MHSPRSPCFHRSSGVSGNRVTRCYWGPPCGGTNLGCQSWLSYWQQPPGPCPWDGISSLRRTEQYGTLDPSCGLSTFGHSTGAYWPPRVLNTISETRALSTRRLYALKWSVFSTWCLNRGENPSTSELAVVLSFLQELLDKGRSHSTLKVFVAAIAAFHAPIAGQSVGRDNSVVRFLKGARRLNPPRPLTVPTWDLPTVLRALKGPPFEPLQSTNLRSLSLKTALLLALASVKRVGDLQALSIRPACLEFGPNDSKVVLKPRHGYVPKVLSTPFRAQVITLSALPPSEEDRELSLLCPVRALRIYFERSTPFRHTEQLFVSFGNRAKGHPVTKQRLSKWIVDAIMLAYSSLGLQCPIGVRAHSTRGIASVVGVV